MQQFARELMDWYDSVEREMGALQAEPEGEVRISLPTGYSSVEPMRHAMQHLYKQFPKIRLVLSESNRLVNLQQDTDIAIRAVITPDDPDSVVRPLAKWKTLICASPKYLEQHPINRVEDLLQVDWFNHNNNVLLNAFKQLGLPEVLPIKRTDCPDSSLVAREYARAGMGVAVLLSGDVSPFLEQGSLTVVLPEYELPDRTLYAATAHRSQSAKVRIVLDMFLKYFGESKQK